MKSPETTKIVRKQFWPVLIVVVMSLIAQETNWIYEDWENTRVIDFTAKELGWFLMQLILIDAYVFNVFNSED